MNRATASILLVEDNPTDALLFQEMLGLARRRRAWVVETSDSLNAALKRLGRPGIEAVVLDLGLPDCAGLDGVTTIASQFPEVPIVVLTGLDEDAMGLSAIQAGAQDYLMKGRVDIAALSRALAYSIERKGEERRRLVAALDRFPMGILLMSPSGRVFMTNRVAEEILEERDGLRLEDGYLRAATRELTTYVRDRLAGSRPAAHAEDIGVEAIRLPRQADRRPLSLLCAPMRSREANVERDITSTVAFLTDPERPTGGNESVLERLYGLSRAEARLACGLMEGKSLKDAAQDLRVTIHTVRTQLKGILDKTNTNRQVELVRLLLGGSAAIQVSDPAPGSPSLRPRNHPATDT